MRRLTGIFVALALLLGGVSQMQAAPITFDFQFSDAPGSDGTLPGSIVGTGTVTFANDPGLGSFSLSSLSYAMSLSFTDGDSYTTADVESPQAVAVIVPFGMQERLYWSDPGGGGGGPNGGSLDLAHSGEPLSFEPTYAGGHNLYFEGSSFFGNYLGTTPAPASSAPEPASLTIFGMAIAGLGVARWRKRKQAA